MANENRFTPERIASLRQLTGEQRLDIAQKMYWAARKNKKASLLSEHSDWSDERAEQEVRQLLLDDRLDLIEPFAPPLEEFL
jgi:hypothetical protein